MRPYKDQVSGVEQLPEPEGRRTAWGVGVVRLAMAVFLPTLAVTTLLCVYLSPTTALAARGHLFGFYFGYHVNKTAEEEGRITEENVCPAPGHQADKCQPGTSGGGSGQFSFASGVAPDAVAVNEVQGYVYVSDQGNNRVERFSAQTGEYETEFNGSGANSWEGEAAPTGRFDVITGIAVDNDSSSPSYGDVYVADRGHGVVDKFNANGAYLGQITDAPPGTPFQKGIHPGFGKGIEGVAVDGSGAVWIYANTGKIVAFQFNGAMTNAYIEEVILGDGSGIIRPGFNVNGQGDLFAEGVFGHGSSHYEEIGEFNASGELMRETIGGVSRKTSPLPAEGSAPTAVAVDRTNDGIYVSTAEAVAHVTAENMPVEQFGEGHLAQADGVAVDARSQTVYVADRGGQRVAVFGPEPPTAPNMSAASVAAVGSEEATVNVTVNPRSESGEPATMVEVEYGRCASLAACPHSPYGRRVAILSLPPDFELHAVADRLEGLSPHTVYHVRFAAADQHGAVTSEELTYTTQPTGFEFSLPDHRAWEMISPPDKHGSHIFGVGRGALEAAANGGAFTYLGFGPVENEAQGNRTEDAQMLSRRSATGWFTQEIAAPNAAFTGYSVGYKGEYKLFSSDLSQGLVYPSELGEGLLSPEASGWTPYLRRDFVSSTRTCPGEPAACWTPLVTAREPYADVAASTRFLAGLANPNFLLAGSDLSLGQVVIRNQETGSLYRWTAAEPSKSRMTTVGVLPGDEGGAIVECETGGRAELGNAASYGMGNAVSVSGAAVFFEVEPNAQCGAKQMQHHLYVREFNDGRAEETVRLDVVQSGAEQAQREAEQPNPTFQVASANGFRVLFTDTQRLTADAGKYAGNGTGADLYLCEIKKNASSGGQECVLTDLTPKNEAGAPAEVAGQVLGSGEDANYVYFVARAVLPESGANAVGSYAESAHFNLYEARGSALQFVATLGSGDSADWGKGLNGGIAKVSRVSPDGRWLEFMSDQPLTNYDNHDVVSRERDEEVYLYNGETHRLVCASCNPTGAQPEGAVATTTGRTALVDDEYSGPWENRWVAATVPALNNVGPDAVNQPRYLSDGGRLFFDARDPLSPWAKNHTWDVYEYEPPTSHEAPTGDSCTRGAPSYSEQDGGCISLISSGTSEDESAFLDASENGADVFFLTSAKLVSKDYDTAYDVYDAHVCSAESPCVPESQESLPCVTLERCREAPQQQPQVFGPPSTATFAGKADVKPAKPQPKKLTRKQKLKRALKRCSAHYKHNPHKRRLCKRRVRRRFLTRRQRLRLALQACRHRHRHHKRKLRFCMRKARHRLRHHAHAARRHRKTRTGRRGG